MALSPETRSSLIARLPDVCDHEAWRDFVEIYEPFIYRQARSCGLQDADAREVIQDVLVAVSKASSGFQCDSERGRFRTWLYAIGRNVCLQHLEKLRRHSVQHVDRVDVAADSEPSAALRQALRKRVFLYVAAQVRNEFQTKTWQAFWQTAVENQPVALAAKSLAMSVGSVYIARSRVMARMRVRVQELTEDEIPTSETSGDSHEMSQINSVVDLLVDRDCTQRGEAQ
ncbi:MAG: sigma-70 family RNA polymerase sigma factor [Aureliella sp.]